MAYREIIEISEDEVIEIEVLAEGVSVFYSLEPAKEAFRQVARFCEDYKHCKHHSTKFKFHIMINQ